MCICPNFVSRQNIGLIVFDVDEGYLAVPIMRLPLVAYFFLSQDSYLSPLLLQLIFINLLFLSLLLCLFVDAIATSLQSCVPFGIPLLLYSFFFQSCASNFLSPLFSIFLVEAPPFYLCCHFGMLYNSYFPNG